MFFCECVLNALSDSNKVLHTGSSEQTLCKFSLIGKNAMIDSNWRPNKVFKELSVLNGFLFSKTNHTTQKLEKLYNFKEFCYF